MNKEEQILQKRFIELAQISYTQNRYTFTNFLNIAEQDLFYRTISEFPHVAYRMFGGNECCERKLVKFGSEEQMGYACEEPISCLHIRPSSPKFAENLTHRDYLGAFMHLGVDRNVIGDLFLAENEVYVYCLDTMADFFCENLTKAKHTQLICEIVSGMTEHFMPKLEQKSCSVASERLDAVISGVYHLSRSQSQELFRMGKIYVNGKLTENHSFMLKENDLVSVRGKGRFYYRGSNGETRKGKTRIQAEIF